MVHLFLVTALVSAVSTNWFIGMVLNPAASKNKASLEAAKDTKIPVISKKINS